MANRYCKFHGFAQAATLTAAAMSRASCAVYHSSGSGRRMDGGHGTRISSITCSGSFSGIEILLPKLGLRAVEHKLGGSGNVNADSLSTDYVSLCGGEHGAGHTSQKEMASRYCKFNGFGMMLGFVATPMLRASCAVYHSSGSGRRMDGGHGTRISSITCAAAVMAPPATPAPTRSPTHNPTAFPTANPTAYPTANPTAYPTNSPTEVPASSPTPSPTPHPCDDGSHGCDKNAGGICYKGRDNSWTCGCYNTHWCSAGCAAPHVGHTCTLVTPSPTAYPTPKPPP
jgi:hypothetical protein